MLYMQNLLVSLHADAQAISCNTQSCKTRTHKALRDQQQASAQQNIPATRSPYPSSASLRLQQLPSGPQQQQPSTKTSHSRSLLKLPPGALYITRPSSMQRQSHKRSLLSQQQQQLAAGVARKQVVAADTSQGSRTVSMSSSRRLEAARAYAAAAQAKQQGELKPAVDRMRSKVHPWPYYKPHRTHDVMTLWCSRTSYLPL